jgi:hypothetical protein
VSQSIEERLERCLGRLHARLRLGIEADHEAQVFGQGINYFHIENLPPSHIAIRLCLKAAGLYGRGRRNATKIELRQHDVISARLPEAFDGFTEREIIVQRPTWVQAPVLLLICSGHCWHKLLKTLAGVEGVALSRRFNILIQGEGRKRPIEPQIELPRLPSPLSRPKPPSNEEPQPDGDRG